jgi:porphobilinogen synthase
MIGALTLTRRLRRLRRTPAIRGLVRETRLSADQFILPFFVCEGSHVRREVSSMPGVFQLSVDETVKEITAAAADGVRAVLLFGLPAEKDEREAAYDDNGPVQRYPRHSHASPDTVVITDVCLVYLTRPSDRLWRFIERCDGRTARARRFHAEAGAHIVTADMMDGASAIRSAARRPGASRSRSWRTRYCSFLRSIPRGCRLGAAVRRSAQSGWTGQRDGRCERSRSTSTKAGHRDGEARDVLDILAREGALSIRRRVSGERRIRVIKAAARNGWIDEGRAMMESLTRSGAPAPT